jgi:serralysin
MSGSISRMEFGTDAPDTIIANPGETLFAFGFGANDTLTGAELPDLLSGGEDNDSITGNAGDDLLNGLSGDDTFDTGEGNDLIFGGSGNDTVGGMAGSDVVFGDNGDDLVAWNDPAGDRVFGNRGNDTLRGGDVAADSIFGGGDNDLIAAVADQGLATHAPDIMFGGIGNDTILGGNADDTIRGGEGDDGLAGFGGADRFVFLADQPGSDAVSDFDTTQDVAVLVGFGEGFDPLANLSQGTLGAVLDLGDAADVLFLGRLVAEIGAEDFVLSP